MAALATVSPGVALPGTSMLTLPFQALILQMKLLKDNLPELPFYSPPTFHVQCPPLLSALEPVPRPCRFP